MCMYVFTSQRSHQTHLCIDDLYMNQKRRQFQLLTVAVFQRNTSVAFNTIESSVYGYDCKNHGIFLLFQLN